MNIVYPSKPAKESFKLWNIPNENLNNEEPTARRVQAYNEIPKFEVYNYLDGPAIDNEKNVEYVETPSILVDNVNNKYRQSKAYEPIIEPNKDNVTEEDAVKESNIVKVKPNYDLPTFTIKNEFSPIFYYIDNVESRQPAQQTLPQTKLPKNLFGHKTEPRPKKTFTYQGFADFTTIVGDTVIIFTPNTDTIRQPNPDEVNVFPSAKPVDKLATKITFLSADIPVATSTYNAHEENIASKLPTSAGIEDATHQSSNNDEESAKKDLYDKIPDSVRIQYSSGFDFNLDVIQPSEPVYTTTESTQNTDDLDNLVINAQSSQATEPLTTLSPSSTWSEDYKGSVVTEGNINELFTNSEEETENTAAEITETTEEDEESEEHESTQEMEPEILTTTESGHSEESEEIETTTENVYNKHKEVFCNDGLETQSTMTTEYKTLTYLTTYFIPLESTDTTTSIKSDVVVESNVGYLTNVVCKTNSINIEPTAVITVDVKHTEKINLEDSDDIEDNKDHPLTNAITENTPITTPMQKETFTTMQDEEQNNDQDESKISLKEKQTTEKTMSSTADHVSTSQSHVEVSVSTEHTPTEKPNYTEPQEEVNDAENEIDLIFKTLYTTYTYFTTFFGEQTSSVASHKSVVTNIITSTVDLSKLDPSLFGAFDDDGISPTNVGIGRPTETFAINSIIDLVKNKDVIESVEVGEQYSSQTPTPILGDDVITNINPDSVKTYFTTYTFFTTIYVGSDANVCSRNEVYTNYVGPDELIPTKTNPLKTDNTRAQFDFRNCKQVKGHIEEESDNVYDKSTSISVKQGNLKEDFKNISPQPKSIEVDMLFSVDSNPLISENSYVTDVKSSSSKGETKYLDNNVLDDQISSESNIDEIMPSPTLLLQTSYTTFTYFTTMYIGKDSSKVKSRLETITNVVTETITPKTEPEEENNLPITYYTTFTYWTTLYKDKSTTITSREEIVSNIVTPTVQVTPTESPIDTSPIDIESELPSQDLEVVLKPSLLEDTLEHEDGKATFYTTYTYFTTFYTGNTSLIRSSLATVTNIVDNTKVLEDNQLGRKVPAGAIDKNLIQDKGEKISNITPTPIKEEIKTTQLPDLSSVTTTVLQGTYIDNLFAEVKPQDIPDSTTEQDKKIIFSQIAVISGDSSIVTNDNKTIDETTTVTTTSSTTTETSNILTSNPEVIESSVTDPETTTNSQLSEEEDEDDSISTKRGRLSFTSKKPTFTPVIIPFASRNRPTFSPKRQLLPNSATTITRPEFTPTITATPTLKSVRQTGNFGGNRKPSSAGSSSISGRRFSGRSSATLNLSANIPASRPGGFGRASIQPSSRRTGFRSSSLRVNSLDYASKSALPKIRPTATSRLRVGRQSSSTFNTPPEQNEYDTYATQQDENATEALDEITESPVRQTTNNPLLRFRRPPVARQPGTSLIPRSTTPTPRRVVSTRGRITTTTRRTTTRTTNNPLLSLRRQRPNSLFPRRNLFKQPEPEPEEEIRENEQKVDDSDEILDEEEFEEDNDYDSSDRREQKVASPAPALKRSNVVSIRPFGFKRRVRRQVDYGNRKYNNFRRPGTKSVNTRKPDPEPETEAPAPQIPKSGRYNARVSTNSRSTTVSSPKSSARQPFIVRGESRTTTTSSPAYKRGGKSRTSSRTTTLSSRPKAPRLSGKSSPTSRSNSGRTTSKSRARTTTSRASSRQRSSFENLSGERYNKYENLLNDGKITITHQIPIEVTIPVVNGKITEYKNVLTAKPSVETLLLNQVATSVGPLGNQQLVLAVESTELADNGATKLTKFVLHETPTTTVIFTPTTIRGRKTSYSHILPSTVYNVEPVVQTVAPEINANVPLANLLLSQLLLGNQQPAINPLLALQGQALLPQQPVVQTPVTEYKTRSTTYVTTVTDARETVLPITFRGIPILTTIVDPTTNVITATEYVTDTVVTTPTVLAPQPQFNSLLLPLLLQQQQQQQQQQQALQTANPLLGLSQSDLNLLANNLGQNNNMNNDIYSNSPKPNVLSDFNSNEDFSDDIQNDEEDVPPPTPPPSRRRHRAKAAKPSPPKLASVVTLYVSGKHPGEFSTVLSTVYSDDTQTVRKREAIYYEDVKILPSILPTVDELFGSQGGNLLENSIISDIDKYFLNSARNSPVPTQSLESIVGSISNHIKYDASPTYFVKLANPSSIRDTKQSSVDDVS